MARTPLPSTWESEGKTHAANTYLEAQSSSQPRNFQERKTSTPEAKATISLQTWNTPMPIIRTTAYQMPPNTAHKRALSNRTNTRPVTKRQSRFASLFKSLLAVSPMAMEYEATDEKTMEAAQKSSVQPTVSRKPHKRRTRGARPSELRKTRWNRFKYEMGLKMKNMGSSSRQARRTWTQTEDIDWEDLGAGRGEVQGRRERT